MPISPREHNLRSLIEILDALDHAAQHETVTVKDVLLEIGLRAFAPLILIPALILVSPLSGVIGLPTLGASLMFLIVTQRLLGRKHLWLPGWITRRSISGERLSQAVSWMRRPCQWIDNHTHKRLPFLVSRPANTVTAFTICLICILIPALELLPLVTSFFAAAISLFAIGLLARDGLFTLFGYVWTILAAGSVFWLVGSATT